jgi:hypothetical protein
MGYGCCFILLTDIHKKPTLSLTEANDYGPALLEEALRETKQVHFVPCREPRAGRLESDGR